MKNLPRTISAAGLVLLLVIVNVSLVSQLQPAWASTPWAVGDVFVGISNGSYQVHDNAGSFKETISDGLGGFTTGCAFNATLDKLYTTNFSNTKVVVYDDPSPHPIIQVIDTGAASPGGQSESIVFAANGDFFVGHPDGNDDIHRYDAAGVLQQTYNVAIERRGSDWMDLAADQQTMFYTSEGGRILRYNVSGAGAQLADFANIGGISYALRLLPPGDGSGGLLVANTVNVKRLDGSGAVVQTYDAPGENNWFSLNLDPNGTSFWAGDFGTSNFYRFNIATGATEIGPINTGTGPSTLFGICVKGEITAAQFLLIDIKPGSDPNSINCNAENAVIAVAVLTTDDFDATTVDHTTVTFEGASETHVHKKSGEPRRHEEDVDEDGDIDLVFHFRLGDTDLICGSTEGTLIGETFDGQLIRGTDAVNSIPPYYYTTLLNDPDASQMAVSVGLLSFGLFAGLALVFGSPAQLKRRRER